MVSFPLESAVPQPRASCKPGKGGRGGCEREAKINSRSAGRLARGPVGGNLSGKGSHPAGSPTMHQVPSADKTGLWSLEARDRNRREMCLFLRAVRANSGSMESRPIRQKQSRPRVYFPLHIFFLFLCFVSCSRLIKGKRRGGIHQPGTDEICAHLRKMLKARPESPTRKSQGWFLARRGVARNLCFVFTFC